LKRESKGLEIVVREAFEAPNRGDARKGVHSHHTASLEILSVFVSFFLEHVIVAVLDRLLSQHVDGDVFKKKRNERISLNEQGEPASVSEKVRLNNRWHVRS
jgi:hypothetical protein